MTVLNYSQAAKMNNPFIWYGYVTAATSSYITLSNYAGSSSTYYGNNLTYTGTQVSGGTLTGIDEYTNYRLDYTARGVNVNAVTAANLINAGNAYGVTSLALVGNDTINGSIYADYLIGYAGNDLIRGNGGNDYIDGATGLNTSVYSGPSSNYTISIKGINFSTVSDLSLGRDAFDTLVNIERLQFSNTMVAVDIASTQNAGSVYMLYKAAFNRAPDAFGMGYWLAQKDNGSNIVTNIAQGFINSAEFTAKYGTNPSNSSYVDKLYQNVLGRNGDAGGVAYWNQQLDSGSVSKAAALVAFATLPEGAANVASLIANGIPYTEFVG